MQSLIEHSLVARDSSGRRYVVGSGLVALSTLVMRKVSVREAARPLMDQVASVTSETVSLHVRHLRNRICVDVIEGAFPIRRVVPLGEMLPLFAGPSGKVILAFLPESDVSDILASAAAAENDIKRINRQLQQIRANGYIACIGDRIPGVGGLSAPIFDSSGIAAALTVSGPSDRFNQEAMESVADFVSRECASLSTSLGYVQTASSTSSPDKTLPLGVSTSNDSWPLARRAEQL